jgi:hypothetical protein
LIGWLKEPLLAELCSESFNIMLNNIHERFLNMSSKTAFNIKLFYPQRLFSSIISVLKENFDTTASDDKSKLNKKNYIFSLSSSKIQASIRAFEVSILRTISLNS